MTTSAAHAESPGLTLRKMMPQPEIDIHQKKKRPALVWVIFIAQIWVAYLLLTRFFWVLVLYRMGAPQLSDAQRTFFSELSLFDLVVASLIIVGFTTGGLALFLLKKAALYIFVSALAARFVFALTRLPVDGWPRAFGETDIVTLLAWGLPAALCFYCWRLTKKGVLV